MVLPPRSTQLRDSERNRELVSRSSEHAGAPSQHSRSLRRSPGQQLSSPVASPSSPSFAFAYQDNPIPTHRRSRAASAYAPEPAAPLAYTRNPLGHRWSERAFAASPALLGAVTEEPEPPPARRSLRVSSSSSALAAAASASDAAVAIRVHAPSESPERSPSSRSPTVSVRSPLSNLRLPAVGGGDLPPGWEERTSRRSGRPYWWCRDTGETAVTRPSVGAASTAAGGSMRRIPSALTLPDAVAAAPGSRSPRVHAMRTPLSSLRLPSASVDIGSADVAASASPKATRTRVM